MARLLSSATGNFTSSSTWSTSDATALLDSNAGNTALTTSYVASSSFSPGAITIDGIAIKIASRAASPTGTISIELYNASLGASVSGTEVTLNVSDIDLGATAALGGGGWYFFKFASPVLLLVATNYQVRAKTSSTAQVNLFRDATANNWSRQLRTTTNATPGANDVLDVIGEHTGAGTGNSFTVTMNETATTDYGAIKISKRGTLQFGTTASTNYYLKTSGVMDVYSGGTLNIGTSGTPIPSSSSAILEFDSTTVAEFGLEARAGAIVNFYGASKTVKAKLAADASASATSITSDVSTGWLSGDEIAIASTSRTATEAEKKTMSGNASGTSIPIAALTNAHSGTSPTQGELANLTRNVKLRGISGTNSGYVNIAATATVYFQYAEFYQIGSSTASKRGIDAITTTGVFDMQYCSVHDCTNATSIAINLNSASGTGIVVSHNVLYGNVSGITSAGASAKTFDDDLIIRCTAGAGFSLTNTLDLVSNVVSTSNTGVGFSLAYNAPIALLSNITAHSNSTDGILMVSPIGSISNLTSWRNNSNGIPITLSTHGDLTVDGITAFGNLTDNMNFPTASGTGIYLFKNVTLNAGSTLTCPVGITLPGTLAVDALIFENSSFGVTTSHSTGDVSVTGVLSARVLFSNCTFGSTTEVAGQGNVANGYFFKGIGSQKHDATNGNHKTWEKYGTITIDTTFYKTASPSARTTPTSASNKQMSGIKSVAVASGSTVTASVWVRESVSGDGTDYNGNRARLMLRRNAAMGITSDTLIATASSSSEGAWEQISGVTGTVTDDGVLEFYVDCDGTTGWINIDDWLFT